MTWEKAIQKALYLAKFHGINYRVKKINDIWIAIPGNRKLRYRVK